MKTLEIILSVLCLAVVTTQGFSDIVTFKKYPASCAEAKPKKNGIYKIELNGGEPFNVYCDVTLAGAGWLVIQRRADANINFFRNWSAYKQGFGDLEGSFFIGLDKLNNLTSAQPQELFIYLQDYMGQNRTAKYDAFATGNEANQYGLNVLGNYAGNAGDALRYHQYMKFSTYDRDHDRSPLNCAAQYSGAWWYNNCIDCNLNGEYLSGEYGYDLSGRGACWEQWQGINYSYKTVQMMIRPKTKK